MKPISLSIVLIVFLSSLAGLPSNEAVLFREEFNNLDNWRPFFFPGIKKHSVYSIEKENDKRYLKAESNASASAIVYKESFSVYEYPRVRWRWKVRNLYAKGDARTKKGDDYPIRIYIMFEYDPDKAGAFEKMKYGLAKKRYGEYPPGSTLSYVWASKEDPETIITSPYTEKAKIILLEKGPNTVGNWQSEEVNIIDDFQEAFGTTPPVRASIAVMNDSDNTGESSISYLEYIEVLK